MQYRQEYASPERPQNPEYDDNGQIRLRDVVHTGQALAPATGGQRVHDEVH